MILQSRSWAYCCCCCWVASFVSNSVGPHRRQPTRLPHHWDSPGKNTGVGCHFLLQCMKVKSESEVAQWCPTLCDPMDCSLSGSSVHGIFQARALEWGAIAFSTGWRGLIMTAYSLLMTNCKETRICNWALTREEDAGVGAQDRDVTALRVQMPYLT